MRSVARDSAIYRSKFDGISVPQKPIAGPGTSHGPALLIFNGQLHMFWKAIENDDNVHHVISPAIETLVRT